MKSDRGQGLEMTSKNLILGIAGPTGIGKTEAAVRLAKLINGELVSCDSVQVFRHLNIGTNKYIPSKCDPPQHLVDILEPTSHFSSGDFLKLCLECIKDIIVRKKVPILVGGTGLYFDWLINGHPSSSIVSESYLNEAAEIVRKDANWGISLERLQNVDLKYAASLSVNDYYRLVKALAFYWQYGLELSSCIRQKADILEEYDWRCVYLTQDRVKTFRNIDERCESMIKNGLIHETKALLASGLLKKDSIAGRSIGYKETIDFLEIVEEGSDDVPCAFIAYLNTFASATRQYARKQETWFANKFRDEFIWIERDNKEIDDIVDILVKIYSSRDVNLLIDESKKIKTRLRSPECKAMRKRAMRTYSPAYSIYNSAEEVRALLACFNK